MRTESRGKSKTGHGGMVIESAVQRQADARRVEAIAGDPPALVRSTR
jgi:hypothetical protein